MADSLQQLLLRDQPQRWRQSHALTRLLLGSDWVYWSQAISPQDPTGQALPNSLTQITSKFLSCNQAVFLPNLPSFSISLTDVRISLWSEAVSTYSCSLFPLFFIDVSPGKSLTLLIPFWLLLPVVTKLRQRANSCILVSVFGPMSPVFESHLIKEVKILGF